MHCQLEVPFCALPTGGKIYMAPKAPPKATITNCKKLGIRDGCFFQCGLGEKLT